MKDLLDIDPLRLQEEWKDQPSLCFAYSSKLAEAQRKYDTAKARMDVVEAELFEKVRRSPDHYDIADSRVTDSAINKKVITLPKFQEAQSAVIAARHEKDVVAAMVNAIEHRKRALTMLVELRRQEYNAEPPVSRAGREVVEHDDKRRLRQRGHDPVRREVAEEDNES